MKIYDEFTSHIKSAACTETLRKFTERLCTKIGIRSIADTLSVREILEENDETVLDALREETQYVVLMMRTIIEEKKSLREETETSGIDLAGMIEADMAEGGL